MTRNEFIEKLYWIADHYNLKYISNEKDLQYSINYPSIDDKVGIEISFNDMCHITNVISAGGTLEADVELECAYNLVPYGNETELDMYDRVYKDFIWMLEQEGRCYYNIMKLKIINEVNINEVPGVLDLLKDSKNNAIVIHNVPFYILKAHLNEYHKNIRRFISSKQIRNLITNTDNYNDHIIEILKRTFTTNVKKHMEFDLKNTYPPISKINKWDDRIYDIRYRLSTYTLLRFNSKLYMLEGVVAIAVLFVNMKGIPIANLSSNDIIWNAIRDRIKLYNKVVDSDIIDIKNLNIYDHFVLNICGYCTFFKEIDNTTNMRFLSNRSFCAQDIYTHYRNIRIPLHRLVRVPFHDNKPVNITKNTLDTLVEYMQFFNAK